MSASALGDYEVVIRVASDHSCAYAETVTVSDRQPPSITQVDEVDPTDCGLADGQIHIIATGTAPEYSIDNGLNFQVSPDFGGLAPGTYQIEVRLSAALNCLAVTTATLDTPSPPTISTVTANPVTDCGLNDGLINISANGGPLEYSINNGVDWSNNHTFTMLAPNTYDIVVRKSTSPACTDQTTAIIQEPQPPNANLDQIVDAHCRGTSTGAITVSVSGGSGNYHFQWNGPTSITDIANPVNLAAGIYDVTISDDAAPGCRDILQNLVVSEPSSDPPVPALDPLPDFCDQDPPFALPTSQQGFSGTWIGPGIQNDVFSALGLVGAISLTFKPDPDQCALANTIEVEVTASTTPTLTALAAICNLDSAIPLETTQDGYSGIWSGEGVTDNKFDPLGLEGNIELTFTPFVSQCTRETQITIHVLASKVPTLPSIADQCQIDEPLILPTLNNGFIGIWSGPGITNNNFDPNGLSGTVTIWFEPDAGQCASKTSTNINILSPLMPSLEVLSDICETNDILALDPVQNEIIGYWSGPGVLDNKFDPKGLIGDVSLLFTPIASQCALPVSATFSVLEPPSVSFLETRPLCHGDSNGVLEILVNGGTKPLEFDWQINGTGDFNDDEILTNLAAGTYTVSVRDQASCIVTATTTLGEPTPLKAKASSTPESINGAADGTAEVQSSGGVAPYSFVWNTGSTDHQITGLVPGTYSVTVNDHHGCEDHTNVVVNQGNCLITANALLSPVSCWGGSNGAAKIEIKDGLSPLTYLWEHDSLLNTPESSDLAAGSYEVLVEDAIGCQTFLSFDITEPEPLISTLASQDLSLSGADDGQISVSTSGGTPPYFYNWSHGSNNADQFELSAGQYLLTTTDDAGCTHAGSAQINSPDCNLNLDLVVQSTVCFGTMDGTASLVLSSGTAPLTYTWSHDNLLVDSTATNLPPGQFYVTATDSKGCQVVKDFSILETGAISTLPQIKNASNIDASDGAIALSTMGGTAPYLYQWSNGQTGPLLEGLLAGTYRVDITDNIGCQITEEYVVTVQTCALEGHLTIDSVNCADGSDGAAILNITGGVEPITVQWSFDTSIHKFSVDGLKAGNHTVMVKDAEDCQLSIPFEIAEPDLLRIAFEARNETFLGAKDGQILAWGLGGTPPYHFLWNSGQMSDSIGGLKPGTYIVTLEDSHGCTAVRSTKINPANCTLLSNVGVRDVACYGEASGRARLDITSEALPVTTLWSHDTLLQGNLAENLKAGTYSVTIIDQDQCRHTWPFTVEQPDALAFTYDVSHQSLPGLADGGIALHITGGTPGYRTIWNDGSQGTSRLNLEPGIYAFTIIDANNCELQDSIEVFGSEVCQLVVEESITASGCDSSGRVELILSGVRGNLNITWSDASMGAGQVVEGLPAGRYWVTVKDDFCVITDTLQIPTNSIADVVFDVGQSLCNATNSFKITSVTGGTAPYTFQLNNNVIQLNNQIKLDEGSHKLLVTDAKHCSFQSAFEVYPKTDLEFSWDTTITRGTEITLMGKVPDPIEFYDIRWLNRDGTICTDCQTLTISPDQTIKYIFEIVDRDGCRTTQQYTILVDGRNLFYVPNAFTPDYDGVNDAFIVYDGLALIDQIESLEVFDRRGMKIYETKNLVANEEAPNFTSVIEKVIAPQVYLYIMNVRFKEGYNRMIKGDFIVLK